MLDFLLLLGSLALLLAAAHFFVEGISAIAAALGVPHIVIGMTLVAFGTSTPELVVNAISAFRDSTDLAFGNIVGSCLVNTGFVLGVTAVFRPLKVEPSLITREIPMLIVAATAFTILGSDHLIDGAPLNQWGKADGLILLLLFCIFLYYTTRSALGARRTDAFISEVAEETQVTQTMPLWRQIAFTAGGLAGVTLGAEWTVEHAVAIATRLGMSQAVIGLTVISLGTTLPELATCILAARRGNADLALGNVVGSNIFNLLCIGGMVPTISRVRLPEGGAGDLAILMLLTVVLLPIAIRSQRTITRTEGAFLLCIFSAYLGWRVWNAA